MIAFEILPQPPAGRDGTNPWPQWPKIFRIDYGHEEVKLKWGEDPRIFSISSKEFLDDGNGNVRVEWKQDQSGRWNMSEVPDSEQIFEVFLFYSYSKVNDLQNALNSTFTLRLI